MFELFKKKSETPWLDAEYAALNKKKRVLGEFVHSEGYRGFKRMFFSTKYPEAVKNLKKLLKSKPVIPSKNPYGGESLDLSGCKITICTAKDKEKTDVLMLYIDGMFIGSSVPGDNGKPAAMFEALKKHKATAAHVEIRFGTDENKELVFDNYLMLNNADWS